MSEKILTVFLEQKKKMKNQNKEVHNDSCFALDTCLICPELIGIDRLLFAILISSQTSTEVQIFGKCFNKKAENLAPKFESTLE